MKKMVIGTMMIAAIGAMSASFALAENVERVDTQGIRFEIPAEFQDKLVVKEDGLAPGEIVAVYEKASQEAAKEMGQEEVGQGFLFSISTAPEDEVDQWRCGDMSGIQVFAEDDDIDYLFNTATDVRLVRDTNEDMDAAMDEWERMNNWANQEVRTEIIANNPELDDEFFTNTELDMLLARALYMPGTDFELRTLDYPDPLDPFTLNDNDYLEELANDFTYQVVEEDAPDGEYYVLAFNEDGQEIRYDFFKDPDAAYLIRETRTMDGEEYVTMYMANPKEMDEDDTPTEIMSKWCTAVAAGVDYDDDDFDDDDDND